MIWAKVHGPVRSRWSRFHPTAFFFFERSLMIYPDVTVEEWLKKYSGLKVCEQACPNCKATILTDRPFITKDYAGLEGKFCPSCGLQRNSSSVIPVSKEAKARWGHW